MGFSAVAAIPLLIMVFFILAGFFVGIGGTCMILMLLIGFPNIENRGFFVASGYAIIGLIIVAAVVLSFIFGVVGSFIYYLCVIAVILILYPFIPKEIRKLPTQTSYISPKHLLKEKTLIPAYIAALFQGFFFTSVYYSIIDFIESRMPIPNLRVLLIIGLFGFLAIAAVPMGIIVDRFGRKFAVLIGVYLMGISLILVGLIQLTILTIYTVILPILAIGVLNGVFLAFLFFIELAPEFGRRSFGALVFGWFGIGMTLGLIVSDVIKPLIQDSPQLFPVILLFAYFTFTLVLIQLKEPLPSRAERKWYEKVHTLLVISEGGLTLFEHRFVKESDGVDLDLTSGALTGISQLIPEITRRNTKVKIVKQENFSVMLEYTPMLTLALLTEEDLPVLRNKMQQFLAEFEAFFANLIENWNGDQIIFTPAKRLVKQIFEYSKQ
jgi:MFS family permease